LRPSSGGSIFDKLSRRQSHTSKGLAVLRLGWGALHGWHKGTHAAVWRSRRSSPYQ